MLRTFRVVGFKSLTDVTISFPKVAVVFGPNAAGKSNLLDAIQALSRLGTERTVAEALAGPIRGYPVEAFAFPTGGLPELLGQRSAEFRFEAVLAADKDAFEYHVTARIDPGSGSLVVADEYLATLTAKGLPKGRPSIEPIGGVLRIRRKSKPAHPWEEELGLNHTVLSNRRYAGREYRAIEMSREELADWRSYYLDPRVAMCAPTPPSEVHDIGMQGQNLGPFLYRLRAEQPTLFSAVVRTVRALIPSVEDVAVDLDTRRGTIDILLRQDGKDFSSRIASEGSLRVLALCAIALNPWSHGLVAFEEPENGVHPRRLELIADLLLSLGTEQGRQVIVTTHSPVFCEAILKAAGTVSDDVGMFVARRTESGTAVSRFDALGLFQEPELKRALAESSEDGVFSGVMLRGFADG